MSNRHKPIAVAAARELAERYGYDEIVIFAADRRGEKSHVTTYGVDTEHKASAAQNGEFIAGVFGPQDVEALRNLRNALTEEIGKRLIAEGVEEQDEEKPLEIDKVDILKMNPPYGEFRWLLSVSLLESGRAAWLPLSSASLAQLLATGGNALRQEPKGPQGIITEL